MESRAHSVGAVDPGHIRKKALNRSASKRLRSVSDPAYVSIGVSMLENANPVHVTMLSLSAPSSFLAKKVAPPPGLELPNPQGLEVPLQAGGAVDLCNVGSLLRSAASWKPLEHSSAMLASGTDISTDTQTPSDTEKSTANDSSAEDPTPFPASLSYFLGPHCMTTLWYGWENGLWESALRTETYVPVGSLLEPPAFQVTAGKVPAWRPKVKVPPAREKVAPSKKWRSRRRCQLKIATNLNELEGEDSSCILFARGIAKLGFDSCAILKAHYEKYGPVVKVLASNAHEKSEGMRVRPSGLAFVLMGLPQDAKQILNEGPLQVVNGMEIHIRAFGPRIESRKENEAGQDHEQ
eukprot:CAMPEP_0117528060 /NCGR_PEP_ID=MMETSP0784-20121206/37119_1 /TAXON_ID=39447 /ORGANISM="" /LENGTH=350 /DNA_ID=CAMNT_0005324333 /DNA_START=50 /DNA_END=1102 /DNA_ORIENTATION=-